MSYLDVYYRALKDYRVNTTQNRECDNQRSATVKANAKEDVVTLVQKVCHVEMDWIETIEKGLEHVDKAIREDRQFIRSNGEVVDIEKVKTVSKDSVKHLAEHSSLITRYTEGEDIIPDRLYIVERLNDYAVYENRFLYMMLCYLRDFITVRYNEIMELEHTYNASMTMHKKIEMAKRQIAFDIEFKEVKKDDPYLAERSGSKQVIARIREMLEIVHAFLSTPLMEEVAKVPMIKPPVTRTNVLRMNHNFRGALALYEYVASYDKPGYVVTERTQTIQPFYLDMADEFAEVVMLSSFLTYEYGMNIKKDLQAAYEVDEEKRRRAKEDRRLEQIKELKRRIQELGESPEEYMLMLEKRNRVLEQDSKELLAAREQIEALEAQIGDLEREKKEHLATIDNLNAEIVRITNEYEEKIAAMTEAHREEMTTMKSQHETDMRSLREEHAAEVETLHEQTREQLSAQAEQHEAERAEWQETMDAQNAQNRESRETLIASQAAAMQDMIARQKEDADRLQAEWQSQREEMMNTVTEREAMMDRVNARCGELIAARRLSDARLHAMRMEQGLETPDHDFISKEGFEELEHQFEVFRSLFGKEWKKTKRDIRKTTLEEYRQAVKQKTDKEYLQRIAAEQNVEIPVPDDASPLPLYLEEEVARATAAFEAESVAPEDVPEEEEEILPEADLPEDIPYQTMQEYE